jgi:mRNA interferase MazF
VTTKGNRSWFIDKAVLHYMETRGRQSLREQLKEGYRANAERDLATAAEWFPLEEEAGARFEKTVRKPIRKKARRPTGMTFPRRGEIYWVEFDPARGHERKKTRPTPVIQNDLRTRYSSVTIAAVITSQLCPVPYPVDVTVAPTKAKGLSVPSAVQLGQIRSVDKARLVKPLGTLEPAAMRQVDEAIEISLGLVNL